MGRIRLVNFKGLLSQYVSALYTWEYSLESAISIWTLKKHRMGHRFGDHQVIAHTEHCAREEDGPTDTQEEGFSRLEEEMKKGDRRYRLHNYFGFLNKGDFNMLLWVKGKKRGRERGKLNI